MIGRRKKGAAKIKEVIDGFKNQMQKLDVSQQKR